DDHQQSAVEQIPPYRVDDLVHQVGAVVYGFDADPRGELFLDLRKLVRQAVRDGVTVLAHEHEAESEHHLALAVGSDNAAANFVADRDFRHVADMDRHAGLGGDNDPLDLFDGVSSPDAVYKQHVSRTVDA